MTAAFVRAEKGEAPVQTSTAVPRTRVLVVEDDRVSAYLMGTLLDRLGCSAEFVLTGGEAVKQAIANAYDIIFTDIGLPDIQGDEVARRIRAGEETTGRHVPILALTAHIDRQNEEMCLAAGMEAMLSKPISQKFLTESLQRYVPNRVTT